MSMYKVKSAIAGGVLAAVMAAAAVSGTIIQAMSDNAYKGWKQYGESWSSMTLGASGETVASSGCAVTSAAMLMVKSGSVTDDSFTPGQLVGYMSANGGFSSGGSINWNALTGFAPSFVYCGKSALSGSQQEKAEKMQMLLDQGYYLIAVVKSGGHFVAVDSINGSSVTMMDPGSRSTSLFGQYAASGVVSLRLFKGPNSTAVIPETPETTPAETTEPIETTVTEVETAETTVLYTTEAAEESVVTEEMTEETAETTEETTILTETETETTTTETTKETTTTVVINTRPAVFNSIQPAATTVPAATTAPAVTTAKAVTTAQAAVTTKAQVTTTVAVPVTTAARVQTQTVFTTVAVHPVPVMQTEPANVIPAETAAPVTTTEPVIPSRADAGLFRVNNQNFFMTVRFTTTDNLHLREEPNTDSDILLVIPEGTELDVVEINEDFTWGRAAYNGKEGWISIDFAGL